jgi:ABC-2 type transport system ATP-binding protein
LNSEIPPIQVQNVVKKFRIYDNEKTIFERLRNIVNRAPFYEELMVLDDVSFEVNKGEIVGMIGRNGSGKTTLLRLIARIMRPNMGTIHTVGSIVPLLELGTGFEPDMTASDNIIQYGIILGFSIKEIKAKVEDILKFAELEKFANTKLSKFSTGMTARLAFSTAAQVDPDILLVDEVLSVGDLSFHQKSYKEFTSFKERKKTVVLVSHSLEPIRKLCDRALLLDNGKIQSIGEPEKVIDAYLGTLDMPHPITHGSSQHIFTIEEVRRLVDNGDFKSAIACLRPMLKKEPTSGQMNYFFAYCLHQLKIDYGLGLHHYDLALKYGFQEFWVRYARGSMYLQGGDIEAASSDLKRAMMLNPLHDGPKRMLENIANVI